MKILFKLTVVLTLCELAFAQNQILSLEEAMSLANSAVGNGSPPAKTLSYSSTKNVLRGTVVTKVFPGPPNFESIEQGDRPLEPYILILETPVDVAADENDEINQAVENVEEVQLVFSEGYPAGPGLIGKKVEVTGGIFHSHTGYHCTQILLEVRSLVELDESPGAGSAKNSSSSKTLHEKSGAAGGGKMTGFFNNMVACEETGDMSGIELFIFQSASSPQVLFTIAEGEPRGPVVLDADIENGRIKFQAEGVNYTGILRPAGLELFTGDESKLLKKGSFFKEN